MPMSILFYLLSGMVAVVLLYQFSFYFSMLRMRGRSLSALSDGSVLKHKGHVLLYFYSDRCAPCRDMTLLIDGLSSKHDNVVKLNVQRDAALARALGIRATPTFVVVEDGKVSQALLGSQSRKKLSSLLSGIANKQNFSSAM